MAESTFRCAKCHVVVADDAPMVIFLTIGRNPHSRIDQGETFSGEQMTLCSGDCLGDVAAELSRTESRQ